MKQLPQIRREAGVTQAMVAQAHGVSAGTISRYERGKVRFPRFKALTRAAMLETVRTHAVRLNGGFQTDIEDLIGGSHV
tara:strand:+ start:150 stop:386 length:237 start_codon:yes stop_codon:yes gene_type:complete